MALASSPVSNPMVWSEIVSPLAARGTPDDSLALVPDLLLSRDDVVRATLSWTTPDGRRHAGSSLPSELTGAQLVPGGPWDAAAASGVPQVVHDRSELAPELASLAARHGVQACWIVPVVDPLTDAPALLTVWVTLVGLDPTTFVLPVQRCVQLVELLLQWRGHQLALEHAAMHDALTGLANRVAFAEALGQRRDRDVVVLCIDLDGFKAVNDTHGHPAGDAVLAVIGRRLQAAVRPTDLAARLGGDEFAVLCSSCTRAEAQAVAERIRRSGGAPIRVGVATVTVGVSIGVAMRDRDDDEVVLRDADRALYDAKRAGRNGIRWSD